MTDPALVEHLRARAARDPRVAGASAPDRDDLAELVDDLIDEERRILPAAARAEVVAGGRRRGARPRPPRAAPARSRRHRDHGLRAGARCSSSAPAASRRPGPASTTTPTSST